MNKQASLFKTISVIGDKMGKLGKIQEQVLTTKKKAELVIQNIMPPCANIS
jgi:predicted RNA binding protein with dsRBD fold (UPF0201 family)